LLPEELLADKEIIAKITEYNASKDLSVLIGLIEILLKHPTTINNDNLKKIFECAVQSG